jgi:hypothetical protein
MKNKMFMKLQNYLFTSREISLDFAKVNRLEQRDLRILEVIFLNSFPPKNHLTVSDVIGIEYLGSRATIHRGLYRLRQSGIVDFFHQSGCYRTKYLRLTKKALNYYSLIEQIMLGKKI